ncbi:MAG: YceI family protein [Bacteroidota bacterium]
MRSSIISLAIISFFSFSAFVVDNLISWNISDDFAISFKGRGANGVFKDLSGTVVFDPDNLQTALFNVQVDASTIDTGNATKDNHARGKKWFDVEQYPTISFRSQSFKKQGDAYLVKGELSLHGVTKEIELPFSFSEVNAEGLFTSSFNINRKDYGINGNAFGFAVAKELEVELRVPVSK